MDQERFVRSECGGDEALCDDVMSLLRSLDTAQSWLETSPAGADSLAENYGSHTGAFSSVNFAGLMQGLTFSTIYNPNGVEIDINGGTVSATPEPGTWLMFAGGCCALVAIRKLKEKKA